MFPLTPPFPPFSPFFTSVFDQTVAVASAGDPLAISVCGPETDRDHLSVPANGRVQTDFFRPDPAVFPLTPPFPPFSPFSPFFTSIFDQTVAVASAGDPLAISVCGPETHRDHLSA